MIEANRTSEDRKLGMIRLSIGLAQGLLGYALVQAQTAKVWPATDVVAFGVALGVSGFVPLMLLGAAGGMRRVGLGAWAVVAGAVAALFSIHAATRSGLSGEFPPSAVIAWAATAVWIFVAHHLVHAADQSRRLIAPYRVYFDLAWKHAVQLALAGAFLGVFWLVMLLGGALFALIGIQAVRDLISEPLFFLPASSVVFAAAVHLTDVRAALTRGARTLALALLSWMTPLMGGLTIAFLLALPFTGLKPLFEIGSATAVLLGAAAALIVFLNAAYQDGETPPPAVLRWSGRAVAIALVPLLAIAAYGLWLRVGQYGWTPARVIAAAGVLIGSLHALGYAAAAVIPGGPWMKWLGTTNVANAVVTLTVLFALFTPIADPARIAVASQVGRLERGAITPVRFDWTFLRFDSERYGNVALARLTKSADPKIAKAARAAQAMQVRAIEVTQRERPRASIAELAVYPAGRKLPPSLLAQGWPQGTATACDDRAVVCEAYVADLDGDGRDEVLIRAGVFMAVLAETGGRWVSAGSYLLPCPEEAALRLGIETVAPVWPDLLVGGRRVPHQDPEPFRACLGPAPAATKSTSPASAEAKGR